MTVLSAESIKTRIVDSDDPFNITPILDWKKQIYRGSVDLRLDNQFIFVTRTSLPCISPMEKDLAAKINQYQKLIKIPYGENFVLHPNEFIIGSTLEYLSFPEDLTAYLIGRSSWGRLGLIIATATVVNPCFKGNLTLELVNAGNVPIELYPGTRIAQLVFHSLEGPQDACEEKRRYQMQVGPGFSKIYEDEELPYLWMPKYKLIIGLTGHKGAGKGIISRYLVEDRLYKYFSLSHIVRKKYREEKPRGLATRTELQDFGDALRRRHNRPDFLARQVIKEIQESKLDKNDSIVIDGIRNPHEIDLLKTLPNFYLIGINATKSVIMRNLKSRGYISKKVLCEQFEIDYTRDCGKEKNDDGMGQNIEECINRVHEKYLLSFTEDPTQLLWDFERLLCKIE